MVPILETLSAYARRRLYFWSHVYRRNASSTKEAADFAVEAVEDTFSGQRKWSLPEEGDVTEALVAFLKDIVESKIRNWLLRSESTNLSYESLSLDQPSELLPNELLWDLKKIVEDDPELWPLLDLYSEGISKPANVAESLSLSVQEVRNRFKRLRRRLEHALEHSPLP